MPSDDVRFESKVCAVIDLPSGGPLGINLLGSNLLSKRPPMTITGRLDVLTHNRVIEIKTVSKIEPEHILQLAIYAYCCDVGAANCLQFHLYNILDDNLLEIAIDKEKMKRAITMLIMSKYYPDKTSNDEQFLLSVLALGAA